MSRPAETPEDARKRLEELLSVQNGIRWKAETDLRHELSVSPVNVFSRDVADAARTTALLEAVERARAAFLAGEDRGGFLRGRAYPEADALHIPGFPEFLTAVKVAVVQPKIRERYAALFEEVAEAFPPLVLALVRLVHAAPEKAPKTLEIPTLPQPWGAADEPRSLLISGFLEQPLRVLSLSEIRAGLEKGGFAPEAADSAARGVRDALLDALRKWPRGGPYRASLTYGADGKPRLAPDDDVTEIYAFTEEAVKVPPEDAIVFPRPYNLLGQLGEGFVLMGRASRVVLEYLSPLREELLVQAALRVGREEAGKVAIPSDTSIPVFFSGGAPLADRLVRLAAEPFLGPDRELEAVGFTLRTLRDGSSQELTLFDPDFFEEKIPHTSLTPEAWRSEALALLPKVLGPERLALYYATWGYVEGDGDFPFHPLPFLELFGMTDDTRNRRAIEANLRLLTRVEMKISRKYGPGAGTLESAESTFRLIEESKERISLRFRDHPRLEKITVYRHPKTMREIQRSFHVNVPRDAFRLVGEWRPGRGAKDDGVRALALVTTSYVLARAYAGRDGKQGDTRYHGADGFELPLEEIVLASGFTTADDYRKHPGRVGERVAEAVDRLALEFRFFGPGSAVKNGRFRFEPPAELRADLLPIAEKARLTPKRPPVTELPPKRNRARRKPPRR